MYAGRVNQQEASSFGPWKEFKEVFFGGWKVLWQGKWGFAGFILLVLLAGAAMLPFEKEWLAALTAGGESGTHHLARPISYWGDFLTGSLILALMLWMAGFFAKKALWRKAAIASLMAAMLAGAAANCFRLTLGRPRPSAEMADGFYGIQTSSKYHGFPSGHSATAFGSAAAVCVAVPAVGVPAMAGAVAVGWSRMRLRRHHPTDILVGGALGVIFGVALGRAARLRRGSGSE